MTARGIASGLLLLALTAWSTPAAAQDTGGSFGGSSFGSGSGGGGSGGGGSWGGGSSSGGSGSWGGGDSHVDFGSGSSGGVSGDPGGAVVGLLVALAFVIVIVLVKSARGRSARMGRLGTQAAAHRLLATIPPSPAAYVAALQLAIDWRERAAVQAVLERLATTGDLKTRAGLDRLLDETLGELGRRQRAIRLAAYFSEASLSMAACEARFRQIAATERARFGTEVVRAEASGVLREDAPRKVAAAEEGGGFVVVTIVVASQMAPPASSTRVDRNGLGTIAGALAANTPTTILGLEVIWTPAAEQDRLSSAEMQALFPHLRALDPEGPALGRTTCKFCRAVFAAELPRCPQCGAEHVSPTG